MIPEWTLGDRLRKARQALGLEVGPFAERIGVSRNTVTSYEKDQVTRPRKIVLNAWTLATGVDRAWLETGWVERPRRDSNSRLVDYIAEPWASGHLNATHSAATKRATRRRSDRPRRRCGDRLPTPTTPKPAVVDLAQWRANSVA